MAFDVKIPSLGESVTEAVLGRWMKDDGAAVAADEPLLELESDKANMDLTAEQAGTLQILVQPGATVHPGDVVARIHDGAAKPAAAPAKVAPAPPKPVAAPAPAPTAAPASAPAPQSPAVRRIVTEEHLDVAGVGGSGRGGRLTKGDVLDLAQARASAAPAAAPAPARPVVAGGGEERVAMSRLRQVIARRLVEAQHTAAILTTFNEVDMSGIMALRARHKDAFEKKHGIGLGFMSFFVKACVEAASEIPEVNAELQGTEIVYHHYVHMGVAVGSDRGLVVPVVKHAEQRSFADVEKEIARLAGLARENKLTPDDMAGATFTISNGGVYGSLLSTPILNPPQSGILGMHKIEKRPVVVDDQIVVRPMMYLALSYDHRLIDGKGAVTFLVRVKERLEDPSRLLLGV